MNSFDAEWFGDCANTFHEEQKQLVYAPRLGLIPNWNCAHPPTFDLVGASVVDIGGGPISLLLKCVNFSKALVVDPAAYPPWVKARYKAHGVTLLREAGEDFETKERFDEAWIYNVLQHVRDPELVVSRAAASAKVIRLFEWVETPVYEGHPHSLDPEKLGQWLGAPGFTAQLDESGAVGLVFYGVFMSKGEARVLGGMRGS